MNISFTLSFGVSQIFTLIINSILGYCLAKAYGYAHIVAALIEQIFQLLNGVWESCLTKVFDYSRIAAVLTKQAFQYLNGIWKFCLTKGLSYAEVIVAQTAQKIQNIKKLLRENMVQSNISIKFVWKWLVVVWR